MFVGFVFPSTSLLMSLDRKVGFGLGLGSKKLVFWVFGYLNPSLKVNRTDFGLSDHSGPRMILDKFFDKVDY